jgi:hypothetical protein
VELNAPTLKAVNISFIAVGGRFQTNDLVFEELLNVNLETGDIAIQTKQEMMVNWTHALPNFCIASPVVANPIVIGC